MPIARSCERVTLVLEKGRQRANRHKLFQAYPEAAYNEFLAEKQLGQPGQFEGERGRWFGHEGS